MTRVIVADDHALFRQGVRGVLEDAGIEVVGDVTNGAEAVQMARRLRPDVVVMDLHMPVSDGVAATRMLSPDIGILILTVSEDDDDLSKALEAGARGYLLKDTEPGALVAAVRSVAQGSSVLSPRVSRRVFGAVRRPHKMLKSLSARERDVLLLIAEGLSNPAISERLGISPSTVKTYVERLFEKLAISSRSEAAVLGAELGRAGAPNRDG